MWALELPLVLLLLAPPGAGAFPEALAAKNISQKEAEFDKNYMDFVNSDLLNIYTFNHTVMRNRTEGVRVTVNVLSEQKEMPVLFVMRQKEAVVSFQVPLILRGLFQRKYLYQNVSRTLCQPQTKNESETQFFYVDVSTLSVTNASYQLRVTRVENFVLRTNERFSFNATAAQPQYFKYVFPEGVDSVIVKVTSRMAFPCSVMSIQDILCPVYDLDNNVAFIGMYQTMTKKAAITVQKKDFPSNSFYVVVVVKTEDEACGGPLPYYPLTQDEPVDQGSRQKALDVMVSPAITSEVYVSAMLFCLGIFLSFYLLTLLIACCETWREQFHPEHRGHHREHGLHGHLFWVHRAGPLQATRPLQPDEAPVHCYGALPGERGQPAPPGLPQLCGGGRLRHAGGHRLRQERHPDQAIPVRGRPGPEGQACPAEEIPDLLLEYCHHRCVLRPPCHTAGHHLPDGKDGPCLRPPPAPVSELSPLGAAGCPAPPSPEFGDFPGLGSGLQSSHGLRGSSLLCQRNQRRLLPGAPPAERPLHSPLKRGSVAHASQGEMQAEIQPCPARLQQSAALSPSALSSLSKGQAWPNALCKCAHPCPGCNQPWGGSWKNT
uniref:SID1 transmembrane family member 2 n=1 Tax=Chrysemys picta bellii TaxID=8478 RepID=A0A8C3I5P3_CHRPI